MPKMRMNQAIAAGIAEEMRLDPSVVVFGEDVAAAGGPFKTSDGLFDEFGPLRVRDTPISEMGFVGAAVGAASTGLRPVAEIMFIEFLGVALDQLSTEAAKFHYLSGGKINVPMVIRASVGAGLGFGAQHSQTLETWMFATPGLKLAVASSPQNAYGLIRAAIRDPNPVVLLEPRTLYASRGDVTTGDDGIVPLGKAEAVARGSDVTIVSLGAMVGTALEATSTADWTADVIDLRTLVPWDVDAVLESVDRTGRLVLVEEAPVSGGWGVEVAARVAGEGFRSLRAPITRITCPDVPVPFGKELEARFLPSADYVVDQVDELLATDALPAPWWIMEGIG
ncbi:MAG TPA: transketolase C-terminal domain-containing protein [Acidimicrobiia bacterium]|nr:transketolase C-terminal domain-containing protein [Acidimicrobiia bacterium]